MNFFFSSRCVSLAMSLIHSSPGSADFVDFRAWRGTMDGYTSNGSPSFNASLASSPVLTTEKVN